MGAIPTTWWKVSSILNGGRHWQAPRVLTRGVPVVLAFQVKSHRPLRGVIGRVLEANAKAIINLNPGFSSLLSHGLGAHWLRKCSYVQTLGGNLGTQL